MSRFHHFRMSVSIKRKVGFALFFISLFLIILLSLFASFFSRKVLIEQARLGSERNINQVADSLDAYLLTLDNYAKMIISDDEIQEILHTPIDAADEKKLLDHQRRIKRTLVPLIKPNTFIDAIAVYDRKGNYFLSGNADPPEILNRGDVNKIAEDLSIRNLKLWRNTTERYYLRQQFRQNTISLFREIYSGRSARSIGLIQVIINESAVRKLYQNLSFGKTGVIFIMDGNGIIISHQNPENLTFNIEEVPLLRYISDQTKSGKTVTINHEKFLMVDKPHADTGWIVVGLIPLKEFYSTARDVSEKILSIGLISLILTLVIAAVLSTSLTLPIIRLKDLMKQAGSGELSVRSDNEAEDEIGVLAGEFNHMLDRITDLIKKNEDESRQRQHYEMAMLQAQINPHFLNNALENICGLVELDRKEETLTLIGDLSSFYRSVLSKGENIISLKEEIRIARIYTRILNVRYQNRIQYHTDIPEEFLHCRIVRMTLQPLIENAVYHGLKEHRGEWIIDLKARQEERNLHIALTDNGVGIHPALLATLPEIEQKSASEGRHSIGIKATHTRLRLNFGKGYGLVYEKPANGGTRVMIKIPFQNEGL